MLYTLAAAATVTGLNESTILKAIKGGKINGTKDKRGKWHVEAAELHRVFSTVEKGRTGSVAAQQPASPDATALGMQIEGLIRRAGERLQQQLDDVSGDQHAERD